MDKFEKVMEILSQERDRWENLRTESLRPKLAKNLLY
jgi:hypothetical protein